jgi:thioredoxin-like negative regulator of GroEL
VFLEVSGNNRAVTSRYGVRRFPTVLVFANGREIMRREGASWSAQSLAQVVNNALNS